MKNKQPGFFDVDSAEVDEGWESILSAKDEGGEGLVAASGASGESDVDAGWDELLERADDEEVMVVGDDDFVLDDAVLKGEKPEVKRPPKRPLMGPPRPPRKKMLDGGLAQEIDKQAASEALAATRQELGVLSDYFSRSIDDAPSLAELAKMTLEGHKREVEPPEASRPVAPKADVVLEGDDGEEGDQRLSMELVSGVARAETLRLLDRVSRKELIDELELEVEIVEEESDAEIDVEIDEMIEEARFGDVNCADEKEKAGEEDDGGLFFPWHIRLIRWVGRRLKW